VTGIATEPGTRRVTRFARTKFRPATLPATLVARPVLHGRLAEGIGRPLTVVVGSAGAGKSVLLSSWAAARPPGLTSWLSCDGADAHPVRFWLLPTGSYTQMAATLYLSRNTVKTHLRAVYQKLGVTSRSEALQRALDLRLL